MVMLASAKGSWAVAAKFFPHLAPARTLHTYFFLQSIFDIMRNKSAIARSRLSDRMKELI
jgi:hypothetical protein